MNNPTDLRTRLAGALAATSHETMPVYFQEGIAYEQARLAPLHSALAEIVGLFADSLKIIEHPVGTVPEDALVKRLGDQIGYGAMMDSARRCWREKLKPDGIEGGEFTVGHCRVTVEQALARLGELLAKGEG